MSYKIKQLQKDKARELGVTIAPSKNPEKKIDVFIGDKKVASIGANKSMVKGKPMIDYATYKIKAFKKYRNEVLKKEQEKKKKKEKAKKKDEKKKAKK